MARRATLAEVEALAALARDVMAFTRAFGDGYGVTWQQASDLEAAAAARIVQLLPQQVLVNDYGRCTSCGASCPPWFTQCDRCHRSRGWDDDWRDDEDDW